MGDPTTQSNYLQIASEHVSLEWAVDFDQRVITGSALHRLLVKEVDVKQLVWVLALVVTTHYLIRVLLVSTRQPCISVMLRSLESLSQ